MTFRIPAAVHLRAVFLGLCAEAAARGDNSELIAAVAAVPPLDVGMGLRKASLEVAVEEVQLRRERGDNPGSEILAGEILAAITTPVKAATPPAGGFTSQNASEIILRDQPPAATTQVFTPADARYFVVEVRPTWVKTNVGVRRLSGDGWMTLVATLGAKSFGVWHSMSGRALEVDISPALVAGQASSIHFARGNEPGRQPEAPKGQRLSIPDDGHVLVVSSSQKVDHEEGWRNFPTFLQRTAKP